MFVEPRGYSRVISHKTGDIIILGEGPFGSTRSRTASQSSSTTNSASSSPSLSAISIEASASRGVDSGIPPVGANIIPPRLAPLAPPIVPKDQGPPECIACSSIIKHIVNFFNRGR